MRGDACTCNAHCFPNMSALLLGNHKWGAQLHQGVSGAQAYPFVVRKVLRDSSSGGARMLLREMLFDASGSVKPARMSAVLNAALGYVAEQTDGFVDFDAVPAEGAPLQACQHIVN